MGRALAGYAASVSLRMDAVDNETKRHVAIRLSQQAHYTRVVVSVVEAAHCVEHVRDGGGTRCDRLLSLGQRGVGVAERHDYAERLELFHERKAFVKLGCESDNFDVCRRAAVYLVE